MKLLIKGGRLIDPATNLDGISDLLIEDGKIAEEHIYYDRLAMLTQLGVSP